MCFFCNFLYHVLILDLENSTAIFILKHKSKSLLTFFLLLIAFASGRVITSQTYEFFAFQVTVLRVWHLFLQESLRFIMLGSNLLSSSLLSSVSPCVQPRLRSVNGLAMQPTHASHYNFGRERYYFLCLVFKSQSCCHTLRGSKTTNKKSGPLQSQFGNFPLVPVLVNPAHAGFALTPSGSVTAFCSPASLFSKLPCNSQASESVKKHFPVRACALLARNLGLGSLGSVSLHEGTIRVTTHALNIKVPVMKYPNGWKCNKFLHQPYFWLLFGFLVEVSVYIFLSQS